MANDQFDEMNPQYPYLQALRVDARDDWDAQQAEFNAVACEAGQRAGSQDRLHELANEQWLEYFRERDLTCADLFLRLSVDELEQIRDTATPSPGPLARQQDRCDGLRRWILKPAGCTDSRYDQMRPLRRRLQRLCRHEWAALSDLFRRVDAGAFNSMKEARDTIETRIRAIRGYI